MLALAGCGGSTTSGSGEVDESATLRYAHNAPFGILDPHLTVNYAGGQIAMRPIYDSLLTVGSEDGEVVLVPDLATEWETSEDGRSITFELRQGVEFQDGTPFDAEAAVANIERLIGPESTVKSLVTSIERAEATSESTLVLHLSKPDSSVPWAMAVNTTGMMANPANFDELSEHPAGTGPYRFVSQSDSEVVYERWDGYWDFDSVLAKRLVISSVTDVNARYNGLRSGQYDIAFLASPVDAESKKLEKDGYHWNQSPAPIGINLLLNTKLKPLDDLRVRRAISMAINRKEISENLLGGVNPPIYQAILKGFAGHDPALDTDPYDPGEARRLIKEAGAEGATVEIAVPAISPYDSIAVAVQENLAEVGIKVDVLPTDASQSAAQWRTGDLQAALRPNSAAVDPASTLLASYLGGDNVGGPPAELIEMANSASGLPWGSADQKAAYLEISTYLADNLMQVPVVQFVATFLSRPGVVGSDQMSYTGATGLDFRDVGVTK